MPAAFRFAVFCFLLSTASGAQQTGAPPNPQPVTTIRTEPKLELLDVVLTHKRAPVHGLSKSAFRILDNGKPVTPTVFEEHQPTDAPATKAAPNLPPGDFTNVPAYTVGSAANVLLLDALNTPAASQGQVRQQMLAYLRGIPPGTRIAVFTLASRLRLVNSFTTDAGKLAESLRAGGGGQASVLQLSTADNREELKRVASAGANPTTNSVLRQFEADNIALDTDARVRGTLAALEQLAAFLQPIPERKNLIWFSGGFPFSIQPDSKLANPLRGTREYAEQVRAADAVLAAARVAVYPVDARVGAFEATVSVP